MKKNWAGMTFLLLALVFCVGLLPVGGQSSSQINIAGEDIVNEAIKYEGNRVVMDSDKGVQWIYEQVGIHIPGTLDELSQAGKPVEVGEQLQLGDIVFFGTISQEIVSVDSPEGRQFINDRLGIELPGDLHELWPMLLVEIDVRELTAAGIYMGDNRFIISHRPFGTIRIIDLYFAEWQYLGARRIVETERIDIRERVIREGLKYLGTPYEYNSDRRSTETMDCSDFVRRTYYDATGEWIPTNSRTQFAYVEEHGEVIRRWEDLQRGDLIFFINLDTRRISHVAIYLGNNQMLHATSGNGVCIDDISSYWVRRAYYGGNLLE